MNRLVFFFCFFFNDFFCFFIHHIQSHTFIHSNYILSLKNRNLHQFHHKFCIFKTIGDSLTPLKQD